MAVLVIELFSSLSLVSSLNRAMFSAINVYKPLGLTSHDVVARLRRVYGLKKIGHLGTLDPLAEGVLPVCLGQATRLIEYFPSDKRYTAEVTLGRTTTTLDREGDEVSCTDCSSLALSEDSLESVLSAFRGVIQQQVPLYSAVHVGGKKLYELARQGKTADLPVRETTIHALNVLGINTDNPAHPVLSLDVHCSSGTYIRSLARDIGDALGVGAYLSSLVRTQHGHFSIKDSTLLDTIQTAPDPTIFLKNPIAYLDLPILHLANPQDAALLRNGVKIDIPTLVPAASPDDTHTNTATRVTPSPKKLQANAFYIASHAERPIGVVQTVSQKLKAIKIFHWDD